MASDQWLLLITLVVGSIMGVYYYARVILTMVSREERTAEFSSSGRSLWRTPAGVLLMVLVCLVIGLGVFTAPLIQLITAVVPSL